MKMSMFTVFGLWSSLPLLSKLLAKTRMSIQFVPLVSEI